MLTELDQLLTIYPFIHSQSIGNAILGKDLIELQVGTGSKEVHVNGSFHANEWITTPVIIRFLNHYALSITNNMPIRGLNLFSYFMSTWLSLVPMVNPDGVNLVINGAESAGAKRAEVLQINNQMNECSAYTR